jgi:hypothetical protein
VFSTKELKLSLRRRRKRAGRLRALQESGNKFYLPMKKTGEKSK